MKYKQRTDSRRKVNPLKSYKVEKLVGFRERIIKCRVPSTGRKTKEKIIPEYKVRWKGYAEKYDLWVPKDDISNDCIKEFNNIPIDVASKMLATVPVGLHPSSPGYAMAQAMSAMVQQKIILKDGYKMPRQANKKQRSMNEEQATDLYNLHLNKADDTNKTISNTTNYMSDNESNKESIGTEDGKLPPSHPVLIATKKEKLKEILISILLMQLISLPTSWMILLK